MRADRLRRIGDQSLRNRDAEGQYFFGSREARINVAHRLERPHHEAGGDEKHQREGNLGHDQCAARLVARATVARRPAAVLQCGDARRGECERGDEPEEHAGEKRNAEGEPGRQRELPHDQRDHPGHIGIRLLHGGPGFQAGHGLIAEGPDEHLRAIEPERKQHGWPSVQELEVLSQCADHLARPSVDDQLPSKDAPISSELTLPVRVGQDRGLRAARRVILPAEPAAQDRLDPQHRQCPVGGR